MILIFIVLVVSQVALGFPLISTIRDNRRQKRWNERQKKKKENEKKIKFLNKKLKGKDEIVYLINKEFNHKFLEYFLKNIEKTDDIAKINISILNIFLKYGNVK